MVFRPRHKAKAFHAVVNNKMVNNTVHTRLIIHQQIVYPLDYFTDADNRTMAPRSHRLNNSLAPLQIFNRIQSQNNAVQILIDRELP